MVIYKVTNIRNGKAYIGQTISTIEHRWSQHKYDSKTGKYPLQRAIKKYGEANFSIASLGSYETQEDLNNAEQYYIEFFNALNPHGYNLEVGGNSAGKRTDEIKNKISQALKGKKFSEERKARLSAAHKGLPTVWLGRKHSDESKRKISEGHKGKRHSPSTEFKAGQKARNATPIVCLNNGVIYESQREAAKSLSINYKGINKVLRGEQTQYRGFCFEYRGGF